MLHGIGGAGSGIVDGKLYVAGGRDIDNTNYDTLYIYDIATDTWTQGPSMPQGENVPGSAVADGKFWLFGYGTPFRQDSPLDTRDTSSMSRRRPPRRRSALTRAHSRGHLGRT